MYVYKKRKWWYNSWKSSAVGWYNEYLNQIEKRLLLYHFQAGFLVFVSHQGVVLGNDNKKKLINFHQIVNEIKI